MLKALQTWDVLVVEDDLPTLRLLRHILQKARMIVHCAENGEQAVGFLKELKPDFILTDLMMPGMDGWELLKVVRSNPRLNGLPVIVITAASTHKLRQEPLTAQFNGVLLKPIHPNDLVDRIMHILQDVPQLAYRFGEGLRP